MGLFCIVQAWCEDGTGDAQPGTSEEQLTDDWLGATESSSQHLTGLAAEQPAFASSDVLFQDSDTSTSNAAAPAAADLDNADSDSFGQLPGSDVAQRQEELRQPGEKGTSFFRPGGEDTGSTQTEDLSQHRPGIAGLLMLLQRLRQCWPLNGMQAL